MVYQTSIPGNSQALLECVFGAAEINFTAADLGL
jgi:hypothetical protein